MRTTMRCTLALFALLALAACTDTVTEPLTEDEELYRGAIPSASISVDGTEGSGEWSGITAIASDSTGDSQGNSSTDVTALYIARSSSSIFFRLDVAGTTTLPPSQPNTETGTAGYAVKFRLFNQAANACAELEEGGDSLWVFTTEATSEGTVSAAITTSDLFSHSTRFYGTKDVTVGAGQILELAFPTGVILPHFTRIKVFGVESVWDDKVSEEEGGPVTGSYDTLWDVPFCMSLS